MRLLLLVAAGGITALSWLDERLFIAAWLGLSLLFWAISSRSTPRGFAGGMLFGLCFLTTAFHWAPRMLSYTFDCEEWTAKPLLCFGLLMFWEAIPFGAL